MRTTVLAIILVPVFLASCTDSGGVIARDVLPGDATPTADVSISDALPQNDAADTPPATCPVRYPDHTVGLIECLDGAFEGYTLFAPIRSTTTYLIDMLGRVVHTWESRHTPGMAVYLVEDGALLRTAHVSSFGGLPTGGAIERIAWDGTVTWSYEHHGDTFASHHDIAPMPNGNILVLYWEFRSEAEVMAAGFLPNGDVWTDAIVEIRPKGDRGADIVWEWHLWDHLVPPGEAAADHPELLYMDYVPNDWLHTNSIAYHPSFDQIVIGSRNLSEFWVIDHHTTTAEAMGHTGGRRGHGGDFLYRWGHSSNYGVAQEQKLFGQHDVHWIAEGLPGAGDFLLFNNGTGRGYSSIEQLSPPVNADGDYLSPGTGEAFGPEGFSWDYVAVPKGSFYSNHISGAQRLENGNTLICTGDSGDLFEVTAQSDVVWRYRNPVGRSGPVTQGSHPATADVFRAIRIAPNDPRLAGRTLSPGLAIEDGPDAAPPEGETDPVDCTESKDCRLCCASFNLNGYSKLVDWMTPCICGTTDDPGPCAKDCARWFCAPIPPNGTPDPACTDCANGEVLGGSCSEVANLCLADAECLAFQTCRLTCPDR